jgi:hypothetical protein
MIDRPKFEDWQGLRNETITQLEWCGRELGWRSCAQAYEQIVVRLEAERNNLELSFQAANELLVDALTELKSARYYRVVAKVKRLKSYDKMRKQLAEKNIEIARSVADTLKIFNYEGTSGGIARFTINGVPFSADVYDNSVGPLGAQRLDALHKVMANRAEAEGARKGESK